MQPYSMNFRDHVNQGSCESNSCLLLLYYFYCVNVLTGASLSNGPKGKTI